MTNIAEELAGITATIRARRKELDVTQEEFSIMTGVSIRSLSDLENGNGGISLDRLLLITSTLGLELKVI